MMLSAWKMTIDTFSEKRSRIEVLKMIRSFYVIQDVKCSFLTITNCDNIGYKRRNRAKNERATIWWHRYQPRKAAEAFLHRHSTRSADSPQKFEIMSRQKKEAKPTRQFTYIWWTTARNNLALAALRERLKPTCKSMGWFWITINSSSNRD